MDYLIEIVHETSSEYQKLKPPPVLLTPEEKRQFKEECIAMERKMRDSFLTDEACAKAWPGGAMLLRGAE